VASIVNAIGNSSCGYGKNTAILITWDDWGGCYNHVPPYLIGQSNRWGEELGVRFSSAAAGCIGLHPGGRRSTDQARGKRWKDWLSRKSRSASLQWLKNAVPRED
jgi:hypothetical protein